MGTGLGTVVAAPFGAHAMNLAAITAALMAGPDAHPDPRKRWVAPVASGFAYFVLALAAGVATAFVAAAPAVIVEAVAGLALLGVLGGALAGAVADPDHREAAVITFVVGASGITAASIGAPFWGLLAGLLYSGWRAATAGAGGEPPGTRDAGGENIAANPGLEPEPVVERLP